MEANDAVEMVLYVDDVDGMVTKKELKELFYHMGDVESVIICVDEVTKRSLGYGYVKYTNPEDAAKAMAVLNFSFLNGKQIRISYSNREGSISGISRFGTLFFKNLDKGFNKKEVKDIFSAYGNVISCAVELDAAGISKGCGYVQFNREEDALNATVELNGAELNGLILYVGPLCSKQEKELNPHIDENLKFTNVFVGNLSDWITERDLILTFGEFGLINNVEVLRDEGVSKCCGLVNFENWEDAARSVEVLNRRKIHGNIWMVRRADRQYEEGHFISGPKAMTCLCVHHIDHTIEDDEFKKLFSRFGTITDCKFMRDRQGRSQGYGSVVFSTTDEAIEAVSLMNDKSIRCRIGEGMKNRNRGLQAVVLGTLFFKNLDKEIDEKGLKDKFSAYGNVISCSVILDSSGISQGFGYVQFDNEEDAHNATKQLNSVEINGKKLYVNTDITKLNFSVVYVSNFSELMTEEDLQSTFGEYGLVDHVYLARDEDGISKCFGHVCFEKWEDAAKSVEGLNDKIFHGKNWHVKRAHSGCENDQFNMRNLFVKNIDDTVDKKSFEKLFSPFGVITARDIMLRRGRRRNRYGFVEFSAVEEAIEAIKGLNGKWIGSKHLYVGIAERKYINQSLQSQDSTMHQTTRVPPMIATHAPPAGVGQQNFYVPSPMELCGFRFFHGAHNFNNFHLCNRTNDQLPGWIISSYQLVEQFVPAVAGKITGMLLEIDKNEVLHLLESAESLKGKIAEAMEVIRSSWM